MLPLRELFLLDPEIHFLNHGSFGACPRPVFEAYQAWQQRLERQPVRFLGRELAELLYQARARLGQMVGARAEDLALVPNATHAVNAVARSINLQPGDEVLGSDHEYGACDRTWEYVCRKAGARYVRQPIATPAGDPGTICDQLWQGVNERTRLIFISHITSPTALTLPAAEICRRAREAGVLCMVDGAHAPGQIALDLLGLGADFYAGNCHKWMLSPKGAGFLYARQEVQGLIEPLVVSWGWQAEASFTTGSSFIDYLQWTGTHDPAAYLAIPAAIQFMQEHDWESVRARCHRLARHTLEVIEAMTGAESLYSDPQRQYAQMAAMRLPLESKPGEVQRRLYDDHAIEIPCLEWNGIKLMRLSVQGYNSERDLEALVKAMRDILIGAS